MSGGGTPADVFPTQRNKNFSRVPVETKAQVLVILLTWYPELAARSIMHACAEEKIPEGEVTNMPRRMYSWFDMS